VTRYGSVRDALGWLFSARRGPRPPSSPNMAQEVRARSNRSADDLVHLTSLVYGQGPQCLGLKSDGAIEAELAAFALQKMPRDALTPPALRTYKRLWALLRAHGLLAPRAQVPLLEPVSGPVDVLAWTDEDGAPGEGPGSVEWRAKREA
jgi:hypothetical protein